MMYGLHDENGILIQKQPNPADGFIAIPDNAVCGMIRDDQTGEYSNPDPNPPAINQIKAEAERRIIAFCPEWRQRNFLAMRMKLLPKTLSLPPTITPSEQDKLDLYDDVFDHINAIRATSDSLEGTLPVDYTDDSHWPTDPGLDLTDK